MGTVLGLSLGAGLFLVWWSTWVVEPRSARAASRWSSRLSDDLVQSGVRGVGPGGLLWTAAGTGLMAMVVTWAMTGSAVIAACFAVLAARAPVALVRARSRSRRAMMREVWPEAVDHLASGIRAGMALPEALSQLGERGPEPLRAPCAAFGRDYRASGRFGDCLDALKERLADPVADRIVEALRLTREVGGSDVGSLLRTLSELLREDSRTRGELEARQSWTVNAARLASAAPWVVLLVLSMQPQNAAAYDSARGVTVLVAGGAATIVAYRLMMRIGRLPQEQRVMR
ncbi:type II secretion system F family protein [Demequina zhanjiangensis]|uniref:Type II secretion system F family protein n=1 Tax=Demequina zhanjiangensis TaxID=3051659 RepID=A0ABT8G1G6_9MICO|nr:type II secretion system F family protein [Demequina sp. SYSU T00b26]MDN4472867.1 type II secretion system F family protein [Demequina sp. SYSU T00b26]